MGWSAGEKVPYLSNTADVMLQQFEKENARSNIIFSETSDRPHYERDVLAIYLPDFSSGN
jgi:hypothetical protein